MANIDVLIEKLSEKIKVPVEELKADFEAILIEMRNSPFAKGKSEDDIIVLARNRFYVKKTREAGIPNLLTWEIIIYGCGNVIDTVAKQRRMSMEAFAKDPFKASQGCIFGDRLVLTSETGEPLYPNTESNVKMKRVGEKIPAKSFLRSVYGYGYPIDASNKPAGSPREIIMLINGEDAVKFNAPKNQWIRFKGLNKTKEGDDFYNINYSSKYTKFEIVTPDGAPDVDAVLENFSGHYRELGELDLWHDENSGNFNRYVITKGSVTYINPEPNPKSGNAMLMITHESMLFSGKEKQTVTVWIPPELISMIDFGEESQIYIIGRTTVGKARDPNTNKVLEDVPGDIMLNAIGLYAPVLYKVSPDVKELDGSDVGAKEW